MNNEEHQKTGITRKIVEGRRYRIWRRDNNNYAFYSIQLRQTLPNGNEYIYYQRVKFRKGVNIENGTDIVIIRAIENDMPNPKDEYNFIREYMILDYEIATDAIKEYQEKMGENDATNGGEDIDLSAELPF